MMQKNIWVVKIRSMSKKSTMLFFQGTFLKTPKTLWGLYLLLYMTLVMFKPWILVSDEGLTTISWKLLLLYINQKRK